MVIFFATGIKSATVFGDDVRGGSVVVVVGSVVVGGVVVVVVVVVGVVVVVVGPTVVVVGTNSKFYKVIIKRNHQIYLLHIEVPHLRYGYNYVVRKFDVDKDQFWLLFQCNLHHLTKFDFDLMGLFHFY